MDTRKKRETPIGGADSASNDSSNSRNKNRKEKNDSSVHGRWNAGEHERFIEAIKKFGKDWKSVEQYIETRSGSQIRSHAQKFFNRIIKKYGIDKNEVIGFIQNDYNCNGSSHSSSPVKKKRVDDTVSKPSKLIVGCSASTMTGQQLFKDMQNNLLSQNTSRKGPMPTSAPVATSNPQPDLKSKNSHSHPAEIAHSISNDHDQSVESLEDIAFHHQSEPVRQQTTNPSFSRPAHVEGKMPWKTQVRTLLHLTKVYSTDILTESRPRLIFKGRLHLRRSLRATSSLCS